MVSSVVRKRWKILAGVLAVIGLAGICTFSLTRSPAHDGVSASAWLSRLVEGEPRQQEAACQAFIALDQRAFRVLRQALAERDSFLKRSFMGWDDRFRPFNIRWTRDDQWRNAALQALAAMGTNAAPLMPELMDAVYDEDVGLNAAWIIKAIVEMGLPGVPGAARAIQDRHRENQARQHLVLAAWTQLFNRHALPHRLRPVVLPAVLTVLRHPRQESEAVHACHLAGWFRGDDTPVLEPLLALLHHESPAARQSAIATLRELSVRPERVVPALTPLLNDPQAEVRASAVRALAAFGRHASPALTNMGILLEDPVESVRMSALNALADLEEIAAGQSDRIAQTLQSAPESLRAQAARVLITIQPDPRFSMPILMEALDDESWEVRCHAARSLGRLGSAAAPAVPALTRKLTDTREAVQITAVEALGQIGAASASAIPALHLAWNNNQSALGPYVQKALQEIEHAGTD